MLYRSPAVQGGTSGKGLCLLDIRAQLVPQGDGIRRQRLVRLVRQAIVEEGELFLKLAQGLLAAGGKGGQAVGWALKDLKAVLPGREDLYGLPQ